VPLTAGSICNEDGGWYRAGAAVRADSTAASITEFVNEVSGFYKNGATEEELAFTKASLGQSDARAYETPRQKMGFLSRMSTYNLKASHVDEQNEILSKMTVEDFNSLAKQHLNLDDMIMVVVGDKAKYYDDVAALGFDMVVVDADGNPL